MTEDFSFKPEQPASESETPSAQEQLEKLSFPETPEMVELRNQIVSEIQNSGNFQPLAEQYHKLAEALSSDDQDTYNRQQLALMINMASIRNETGDIDQCVSELYDAADCAQGFGFEDEYNAIYDVIDSLNPDSDNA